MVRSGSDRARRTAAWPTVGLGAVYGAGLGIAFGVTIGGGAGIAVGLAVGAGLGVVAGAVVQVLRRPRDTGRRG